MKILNVQMPNGMLASGTFEEWTAALLGGLSQEQMVKTVERLQQIQGARALVQTAALPNQSESLLMAPRNVIMKAEPGSLGAMLGGRNGRV